VVYHDFPWNLPRVIVSLSYYIPSYHHHILILLVFKTLTYSATIYHIFLDVRPRICFSYCILLYYIWFLYMIICYIPIKWVLTSMFDGRISHRFFVSMTSDRGRWLLGQGPRMIDPWRVIGTSVNQASIVGYLILGKGLAWCTLW
jgi:hypothetical protein